jgi:hypothetical protein
VGRREMRDNSPTRNFPGLKMEENLQTKEILRISTPSLDKEGDIMILSFH